MYSMSESLENSRHRSILQGSEGDNDRSVGEETTVANCTAFTSSSVGVMADSYIPYMALSDLRLILRLTDKSYPFAESNAVLDISWTITDVQLSISLLELDNNAKD